MFVKIEKNWGLGIGDWGLGIGDWADPAIVNFLLEHLRTPKVDFSKIKFPSYIKYLNNIK